MKTEWVGSSHASSYEMQVDGRGFIEKVWSRPQNASAIVALLLRDFMRRGSKVQKCLHRKELGMSRHSSMTGVVCRRLNIVPDQLFTFTFAFQNTRFTVPLPFLHLLMIAFGKYSLAEIPVGWWE